MPNAIGRRDRVAPCLPCPSGPEWIHEIKHEGYRLIARRDTSGVRLLTRNGYDWAHRFPLIAEAAGALQVRSFLVDGEVVCCDHTGVAVFESSAVVERTGTCSCMRLT